MMLLQLKTVSAPGRRCRSVTCSSSSTRRSRSSAISPVHDALLRWADISDVTDRPVAVEQHPEYGRCLVATKDIPSGTVLLSVPLEQVFQSQSPDDLELHWAAEVALRLLQARHVSRQQHDSSSKGAHSSNDASSPAFWGPWVDSLPQHVVTPVAFTTEEVEQLVIPSTVQAVMGARESLEGCFEVLQPQLADIGATWQDLLWAVQVLHSRCFFEGTSARHMAVPGVDMCNHSYQPNAAVRLVHSPAACQGLDALEEVAPVVAAAACPSYFQLVAGSDSIQAGEQVTISYGPWPTEPLLLLFGFVPQHNPHDTLVLFSDLQHMADCWLEMHSSSSSSGVGGSADQGSSLGADPAFAELLLEQLSIAEEAAAAGDGSGVQQPTSGPPGFRDLSLSAASTADVRLSAGLQVLQKAVAAAVEQWHRQRVSNQQEQHQEELIHLQTGLKEQVPALVQHRLQKLAQQLEASAAAAADSSGDEQTEVVDDSLSYTTSAEHRSLIAAYCSSKAKLARQLLAKL